jgi:polyphosphate kinase
MAKSSATLTPNIAPDASVIASHFVQPEHRFFNREISWLAFNTRVLEEAMNPRIPLLERLRFLSISAGNLDEFYMVRVAGLKDQVSDGVTSVSADGLTPAQQLEHIDTEARKLMHAQQQCWLSLRTSLAEENIHIVAPDALDKKEAAWLRDYFEHNIFPVLTPIAVDPSHPFPFVPNLGVMQTFEVALPKQKRHDSHIAILPFPLNLPRFVHIYGGREGNRFMLLEDLTAMCVDLIFPGYHVKSHALFRIVRDSDLDIEEEAEDLMRNMNRAVKARRHGRVVRVKASKGVAPHLLDFMLDHLPASRHDVVEAEGMVGLSQLSELVDIPRADLKFSPFKVRYPERLQDYGHDCFAAISAKDFVVHHPFESFDVVVRFLNQAADDPDVMSIKQTLYRTSKNSPIVEALIRAAENGKAVTALVELKARFDEEANIRWAQDMERAGVQVVYGFIDLKTHAKISLVVRKEREGMKSYAHFGTGNYHPITAQIYTDLSFFTCEPELCQDAAYVFNYITGYSAPTRFDKLAVAPLTMRRRLMQHIANEIAHAQAGKPAAIWAKMNALIDPELIDALYAASQAGVKIDLVVRGICGLKPGIAGFSDNIRVKSIVGRFLEHSRIYAFGNGHGLPSAKATLYISSADGMKRNLDHRVEVLIPIENPTVHAQILDQIMVANMNDVRQSWELMPDGSYHRLPCQHDAFAAHDYFMNNPSLSGRGKALKALGNRASQRPRSSRKKKA